MRLKSVKYATKDFSPKKIMLQLGIVASVVVSPLSPQLITTAAASEDTTVDFSKNAAASTKQADIKATSQNAENSDAPISTSSASLKTGADNTVVDFSKNAAKAAMLPTNSAPVLAIPAANQSGDMIEKFANADFTSRKAMIDNWQGTPADFDKLVALIHKDELYRDNSGKIYTLENNEHLFSYPAHAALKDWPSDLNQVTLNNELRSALVTGQAKVKLSSTNVADRLAAITTLDDNLASLDKPFIDGLYAKENDATVKTALSQLKARIDFNNGDDASKIAALPILADSSNPKVMADIDQVLVTKPQNPELVQALTNAQSSIKSRIKNSEMAGYVFSGLSTASILLLAALGLAITYGLLGVINMAHGELIMIGAYTTYVIQNLFKTHFASYLDWYMLIAIPMAFLVSAVIGMVIERVVIKPLYGRQLETLLATFGVSLILMQSVRMIFGAQNVAVDNIGWLNGAYAVNSSLVLPYNRIAIIAFTLVVLAGLILLINKTRFGLFIRAVTQNRQMARAVGIRSARVDMLAFGLGSGLAGLAGCALAQIGNVGPSLGQGYIIDTFLVVVVGGVGQVWGAVLAALGLGVGSTALEIGFGAVIAKITLLILVILFIQKRPKGLFAVKGRFVD